MDHQSVGFAHADISVDFSAIRRERASSTVTVYADNTLVQTQAQKVWRKC